MVATGAGGAVPVRLSGGALRGSPPLAREPGPGPALEASVRWRLVVAGFFALAIVLTLLTFLGEAVRDAFDPKSQTALARSN